MYAPALPLFKFFLLTAFSNTFHRRLEKVIHIRLHGVNYFRLFFETCAFIIEPLLLFQKSLLLRLKRLQARQFFIADLSVSAKQHGFRRQDLSQESERSPESHNSRVVRLLATMQEQGTMILPSFFGKAARSVPRRGEIPVIPVAAGSPQHSLFGRGASCKFAESRFITENYGQQSIQN